MRNGIELECGMGSFLFAFDSAAGGIALEQARAPLMRSSCGSTALRQMCWYADVDNCEDTNGVGNNVVSTSLWTDRIDVGFPSMVCPTTSTSGGVADDSFCQSVQYRPRVCVCREQ